jgi:hypothetical protein
MPGVELFLLLHVRCFFLPVASLELPSIGWQLFILGSSNSDSTAFPSSLDTYATRLLTEPLKGCSVCGKVHEILGKNAGSKS